MNKQEIRAKFLQEHPTYTGGKVRKERRTTPMSLFNKYLKEGMTKQRAWHMVKQKFTDIP